MVIQAKIHRLVQSKDVEERKRAVEELKDNFSTFEDKEQCAMARPFALGACYPYLPEESKEPAWDGPAHTHSGQ